MKKYLGLIWIVITFLITWIFWNFATPTHTLSIYRGYSQFIASLALVSFAWINYISSRHFYVDRIFNGLDSSYIYHKYLSIIAILFVWIHNFTLKMGTTEGGRPQGTGGPPNGSDAASGGVSSFLNTHFLGNEFGSLSMYIFTAFIVLFILAYKFEYQKWKILHKLMIIPYAFGVFHYYFSAEYSVFSLTPYTLWMDLINVIGVLTSLYSIFLYEKIAFKYKYKISNIKEIAKDTLEITGLSSGSDMKYEAGQFAFLKVLDKKKGFPSHPFTISQAYKKNEIQFAIKSLGDHTAKLKNILSVGDVIGISEPFGRFDFKLGVKHQIWIAGGIGITPFRSFLQYEIPKDYKIDFFYAYNNEEEGAYVEEIKNLEIGSNVNIHLFDSSKTGFLKIQDFEKCLDKNEEYDVYFCGPNAMRIKIKKDLKENTFKIKAFHYEHFQFK